MKDVVIIGSGFAGLSAACHLARQGAKVTVLEKHTQPGGRARAFQAEGFTFDMGPSWYWMPDVFENFFAKFSRKPEDYYQLLRLDPSYKVIWEEYEWDIPANFEELCTLFDTIEEGSSAKLRLFVKEAGDKYRIAMEKLVYMPGLSLGEFLRKDVITSILKMDIFQSIHKHVRKYFSHPAMIQLAEFPILFLGALPKNTPALYSLMNYADIKLGTWYPAGGMVKVVEAIYQLALELGVEFSFEEEVREIMVRNDRAAVIRTNRAMYGCGSLVAACDYNHAELLLPKKYRNYTSGYWRKRKMSPSCLLYYVGVQKKVDGLRHHTLFFDASFDEHANRLYGEPAWPESPLMYVCCPSKTDHNVAPQGCENLFILIPVAAGLKESEEIRERYFNIAIERIEQKTGVSIKDDMIYKRSYAATDFITDYHSYKGNAYGLSNTLSQTAILKPSIRNKKIKNMYYAGQLTVPGPGVPPAIISGEIVAAQIIRQLTHNKHTI
jgi:phytoene desaturase